MLGQTQTSKSLTAQAVSARVRFHVLFEELWQRQLDSNSKIENRTQARLETHSKNSSGTAHQYRIGALLTFWLWPWELLVLVTCCIYPPASVMSEIFTWHSETIPAMHSIDTGSTGFAEILRLVVFRQRQFRLMRFLGF